MSPARGRLTCNTPRLAEKLRSKRGPLLIEWRLGIQPGLCEALQEIRARIEPVMLLRHAVNDRWIDAKRLAGFA